MDEGTLTMPNETRSAPAIRSFLANRLSDLRVDNQAAFELLVASGEAVANACLHGRSRDRKGVLEVTCDRTSPAVVVTVSDDGPGFDPHSMDFAAPPHPLESGRRGFFLMREMADDVVIESNRGGTKVTLVRKVNRRVERKAS